MNDSGMLSKSQINLLDLITENLATQPNTNYLDLKDNEIGDLEIIIEQLSQFANLEELNLSNNPFT